MKTPLNCLLLAIALFFSTLVVSAMCHFRKKINGQSGRRKKLKNVVGFTVVTRSNGDRYFRNVFQSHFRSDNQAVVLLQTMRRVFLWAQLTKPSTSNTLFDFFCPASEACTCSFDGIAKQSACRGCSKAAQLRRR
jgi:hypothetical protein